MRSRTWFCFGESEEYTWAACRKLDENFGAGYRQPFSGADVERHALPAPGIDFEPEGREGFDLRVRRYALFVPVAAELAAHDVLLVEGRNRLQNFDLLVANGFAVQS